MALEEDIFATVRAPPPADGETSLSRLPLDMGRAAVAGATDLGAQAVGGLADVSDSQQEGAEDSPLRRTQRLFNTITDETRGSISPGNKRAMEREWIPKEGEESGFKAPLTKGMLTLAGMAPTIAGFVALTPAGAAGVAVGTALGAGQSMAQLANDNRKMVEGTPDDQLKEKYGDYFQWRDELGLDEESARRLLLSQINAPDKLAIAGAGGAVGGGFMGHALRGQAARGALRGTAVGAAEGVVGGMTMGAAMQMALQKGEIDTGARREYEAPEILRAGANTSLEVGALSGGMGAVGGSAAGRAVSRAERRAKAVEEMAKTFTLPQHGNVPDAAQTAALTVLDAEANASGGTGGKLGKLVADYVAPVEAPPEVAPTGAAVASPAATPLPPATPVVRPTAESVAKPVAKPIVDAPAPDWVKENNAEAVRLASELGLTERIQQLATEGKTADEISKALGGKLSAQEIRAVRASLGIEAAGDTTLPGGAVVPKDPVARIVEALKPLPPAAAETPTVVEAPASSVVPTPRKRITLKAKAESVAERVRQEALVPAEVKIDRATGRRVLGAKPTAQVVEAKATAAATEVLTQGRAAEATGRRERRKTYTEDQEDKASTVIKNAQPEDADGLTAHYNEEQAALTGDVQAQTALYNRARKILLSADDAGVKIPAKTTWSKDNKETTNPTPYLSRLIELQKFTKLHELAIKAPTLRKKMGDFLQEHVIAEQAIRKGDLEAAAARRQRVNSEMTEAMRGETFSMRPDTSEGKDQQRTQAKSKRTVRDVLNEVYDKIEMDIAPKSGPQRNLIQSIIRRLQDLVGDVPIYTVSRADWVRMHDDPKVQIRGEGLFRYSKENPNAPGHIIIVDDVLADPVRSLQVPIHEAVHAAAEHALHANPEFRQQLATMMNLLMYRHPELRGIYAMDSPSEFLAEVLSNPPLQRQLAAIPAPPALMKRWGIEAPNMWTAFVRAIQKTLGFGKGADSYFDAVLRKAEQIFDVGAELRGGTADMRSVEGAVNYSIASRTAQAKEILGDRVGTPEGFKHWVHKVGLKVQTFTQITQNAEKYFGDTASKIAELKARMATFKDKLFADVDQALVNDLYDMRRRYEASGKWDEFADVLYDETISGAYWDRPIEDQKHLRGMGGLQPKAQWAEGHKRWQALPDGMKTMRKRLHEYHGTRQAAESLGLIRNIIRAVNDGEPYEELAQWIHGGRNKDHAQAKAFEAAIDNDPTLKALKDAKNLSKIAGPYVALMRRGEFVVRGTYDITSPGNARRINAEGKDDAKGNVFEFKDKKDLKAFVESVPHPVLDTRTVHTDEAGNMRVVDDTPGGDGKERKLVKGDTQSEPRYRATVQLEHVSFHDSLRDASKEYAALTKAGLTMRGTEPVKYEPGGRNADFMSGSLDTVRTSLEKRAEFKALDKEGQRLLIEQLEHASLRALGSTRAQTHRLPRTKVAGASTDIPTNVAHYASSSAGYLAKLKYQPDIDIAMKEMRAKAAAPAETSVSLPRRTIFNEIERRATLDSGPETNGIWDGVINRLLQISYLDKLASPAFHIINSMEPWTVGLPYLGARHNPMRVVAEMNRAYADIGAGSAVMAGLKDTAKAFKSNRDLTNYLQRFTDRVAKSKDGAELKQLFEHLYDTGLMSRDAGMELSRLVNADSNMVGRGLDRGDLMARQMGTAIESINRAVLGIAAYRLARTKGTHAEALKQAHTTIHDTMGDYSNWNAAPLFRTPVGRLALQFKKYAQKTYFLLGKSIAGSLKGDPEAMKTFAGLMATHMLMAGALGLPTEAIKVAMMAAGAAGLTDNKWQDVEQGVRKVAAGALGKAGGEIATRGLPRWMGIDLSGRTGMDQMLTPMGEFKSTKTDDVWAYAAKAFAGAPPALVIEWIQGAQALSKGEVTEAARLMTPLKIVSDSVQAYQMFTEGKKSVSGRTTMEPITGVQAGVRALGFTPGEVAEKQEARFAVMGDQQTLKKKRQDLENSWINAQPKDKMGKWQDIIAWNKGQPAAARLLMPELIKDKATRDKEASKKDLQGGLRTTSRDRHLRTENSFYNLPQ